MRFNLSSSSCTVLLLVKLNKYSLSKMCIVSHIVLKTNVIVQFGNTYGYGNLSPTIHKST